MDLDEEQGTAPPIAANMSNKKKELLSTAMKRTREWIFSLELPSDLTVHVGGTSFKLQKFPLVSKCGYIRKLASASRHANVSVIKLQDVPGGAEAFELAAKFCYGINNAITTENVAMLRCVAEYLEMTEDHAVGNLIKRTDACINEVALKSVTGSVLILHSCENLLPMAEKVKLVSRCIDTIALMACKDSQFASPVRADGGPDGLVSSTVPNPKPIVDWWAENLTILRVDLFRRVLVAMMARGFNQRALVSVLMLYVRKSLGGMDVFGKGRKKIDPRQQQEKRVVLETILSLLPREKDTVPVSFLSMLLKAATYLETTVSCKLDLEKRMALQLGQAILDDLLIPSYSLAGDTLFDVETVKRIMVNFSQMEVNRKGHNEAPDCIPSSPNEMEKVTGLMESYLSEISSDRNLSVSNFISLAEHIARQSRMTEDGIYMAIDIYLKAHPTLSEMERKKVCSVMNCQKFTQEARADEAMNERLTAQTLVRVLYHEHQRLREVVDGSLNRAPTPPSTLSMCSIGVHPIMDEVSALRRENQDLKLELMKAKTRLREMENSSDKLPAADCPLAITRKTSTEKSPSPWKSLISSVSRKFGRFIRADGSTVHSVRGKNEPRRVRRHSIS